MGYAFQVVPFNELLSSSNELSRLEKPLDRHQALKVGACSIIVIDHSDQCISGISEEKRCLAAWVRNQRSAVRSVRYKGASSMRGALNADISNASDRTKSQLDWLRGNAPELRRTAELRLQEASRFVSIDEARGYIQTYQREITKIKSAKQAKTVTISFLIAGLVSLFGSRLLGCLLFLVALIIFLLNRDNWNSIKEAERTRQSQIHEMKQELAIAEQFESELNPAPSIQTDETIKQSIVAIAKDLERKHVFLEVACRSLNSMAVSWEQLAEEVLSDMTDLPSIAHNTSREPRAEQAFYTSSSDGDNEISLSVRVACERDIDDYYFRLDLEQAHQIMRYLGYKRMPREWMTLSMKAEERISRFLAEQFGISYEDYYWSSDEGEFKAELLD
ncbi:hypothetical protein [Cyanobium sp. Lug-B]|uniref:hypothetical protein n=1 Tax=Cyanobium sp. Lug-B TaxID=2823716 RepID=UPI0020CDA8A9|nr:hypothetical protein [Cyanobium sp. Lug-B]MCP9796198.1 hypothetical protein [Cyanobium sp. Lug-B]